MTLWQIGLLVFILAGAVNALFLNFDVAGLPRELGRLSVLIGLVILVVGLIRRKKG